MTGTPSAGRQAVCVAKGQEDMIPPEEGGEMGEQRPELPFPGQPSAATRQDVVSVSVPHGARRVAS